MYVYVYLTFAYIILLNYLETDKSHKVMKKVTKYRRPVFEFYSDFEQLCRIIKIS